ncbi:hypothetical protein [Fluviispira multicolorata]|uniref:Uncharacterized protein n=1 Tax=Fluviispira multicolorata TaxID=2654512 RepID=A0A833JCA5_9BACT|nr:hypothetical protein [Fluviispira multicolorata]KAB8029148.1 hypothetical protein GCL57_11460 [Fluviispira multicolorata]
MNMKTMQKTAIKPIPSATNFNAPQKSSFLTRLFGLESQKIAANLRAENQELILMNQRNMEAIKTLSDQLADSLSFQQEHFKQVSERLKIMEALPEKQEALHQKIMDSFDRATFFIQNASQDLIQSKTALLTTQNDFIESAGAIEIAEFMRTFLITNLLTKQIRFVIQLFIEDKANPKDAEPHLIKLQKNLQIVQHQNSQINFKLEKYNLRIEESVFKPYAPELQTAEVTENCSQDEFFQIIKYSQKVGIFEEGEKIKSLVISESLPAISFFNREKSTWSVKRRAKVVILKPL